MEVAYIEPSALAKALCDDADGDSDNSPHITVVDVRDEGERESLGFIDGSDADPASESEVLRRLLQFGLYPQWSS